jgi:Dihydro-orotase-like
MKKLAYLILFVSLCSFTFTADRTYVWEKYKLEITVPDNFRVKKNTSEEFEMKGEGMELSMNIFEGNISLADMNDATLAGAKEMKMTEIDAAHTVHSNGLDGTYVEGFLEGNRVMFAGLINPKNHTNFFVAIIFDDEDKNAEEAALEILNSIRPL